MWWKVASTVAAIVFTAVGARLLGMYLNARYAKRFPTHKSFEQLAPERRTDTVIFVHGLHGHFKNTWPRMPELLHGDPDLPQLDVLLWGYRASVFPAVQRLPNVGQALMSFVRDKTPSNSALFFVGHSMGGLVILDGLAQEARAGRATGRPAVATRYVFLYATPLNGSAIASAIRNTVGFLPRMGYFLVNGHLVELGRGGYCDTLAGEVVNRLYNPNIQPGDVNSKVRVPIKAIVGARDPVVQQSSATFFLQEHPPSILLTDNHFTVKEPVNREDPRYEALQKPLEEYFAEWFRNKAREIEQGNAAARIEVLSRCKHAVVARLATHPATGRAADAPERVEELLAMALRLALEPTAPDFGTSLNMALVELRSLGR